MAFRYNLHADVKGMISDYSDNGSRYFVVIVDEYSRFWYAVPMDNKSKASENLLAFVRWFELHTGQSVNSFYNDGGTECNHAQKT